MIDVYKSVGLLSLFFIPKLCCLVLFTTLFCDQNFQKQVLLFDLICLFYWPHINNNKS